MAIDAAFLNWVPQGRTLGFADEFRLLDVHDGDTPNIRMPIRMLSVDTPEVTARSAATAAAWDEKLAQLADWMRAGRAPIEPELAGSLLPRLETGRAGTLQFEQGQAASAFSKANIAARMRRPDGTERKLFVRTADQPFDGSNRLLAYVAPSYSEEERERMPLRDRPTFNLDLVAQGWAAPFLIYPSLPRRQDMELFLDAIAMATTPGSERGLWREPLSLPGYEYRMAQKLHGVTEDLVGGAAVEPGRIKGWRSRCCADMATRQLFGPEAYAGIPHHRRLWIWPQDVPAATAAFGLEPV